MSRAGRGIEVATLSEVRSLATRSILTYLLNYERPYLLVVLLTYYSLITHLLLTNYPLLLTFYPLLATHLPMPTQGALRLCRATVRGALPRGALLERFLEPK